MKIWIKLLIGSVLGIALGFLLPRDNQAVTDTLLWLDRLAINAGRYVLIPVLFFSLTIGIYELRQDNKFWKLVLYSMIALIGGTALIIVLGIAVILIFQPDRVPIRIEEQAGAAGLGLSENITGLFPANSLEVFSGNGEYLLPICLFAFFFGLGLSYERNYSKPVITLLDSLSRVFYHVGIFFSEILSAVLIVLCAFWAVQFREVLLTGKFNGLMLLLGIFSLVLGFVLLPLLLCLPREKVNPWKTLYGTLGPAIAGFFSGDLNFTLPVLMRHQKENLGIKRRAGTVTLALFSAFGRAGSAAVAAMAFIVIIKSYSSLEVTPADLLFIALRAFGLSFLLARRPGDGAFAALAVLCATYDRTSFLILKPLAFYLIACGTFLDTMFNAVASCALARITGCKEEKSLRAFI